MKEDTTLAKSPLDTMKQLFYKNKIGLSDLLPPGVTVKEVIQSAIQACRENPKLLECTPASMLGAVAKASQLGLPPCDGTHRSCIVSFRNNKKGGVLEAQFMPEYRGLLYLARNCAELSCQDDIVCEKDFFEYEKGTSPYLKHRKADGDRGKIIGAYFTYKTKSGEPQFEYMTLAEMDKNRGRSKAQDDGPWKSDPDMMYRKTVIRRGLRLAPMSSKRGEIAQEAAILAEKAELGIAQDLALLVDKTQKPTNMETNESRLTGEEETKSPTLGEPLERIKNPENKTVITESDRLINDYKTAIDASETEEDISRLDNEAASSTLPTEAKSLIHTHCKITKKKLSEKK